MKRSLKHHFLKIKLFLFSLFFTFTLLLSPFIHAQTPKLDNLIAQFESQKNRSLKLKTVIDICARNYSLSDSNLYKYIQLGEQLCVDEIPEYFMIQTIKCIYLSRTGRFEDAIYLLDSLLKKIPLSKNYTDARLRLINAKTTSLIRRGQLKEAIENCFALLQEAENVKDTVRVLSSYAIMGWANMEIGNYNDAIKWINKGINYTTDTTKLYQASFLFSNIASCYNNIEMIDTAFYYINLALKCARNDENLTGMANSLNIRADMYMKQNNFSAAQLDMEEAFKMREQIGDLIFVISDMAQLSSFYASINETQKGIELAKRGISLAKDKNNVSKLIFLYNALAENYLKANDKDEYAHTLLTIISLKDTLYQKNSEHAIADMEAKYEVQKKEKIIIEQNLVLTKRNYMFYGSITFFVLIGIFTGLLFNQYRQRQKGVELIAVSSAKEYERKRIAAELHDNIGTQLSYITRKIDFVNSNLLHVGQERHEFLNDISNSAHKTISDLRETIWALKKESINLNDLADRLKIFTNHQLSNYPSIELLISEKIETQIMFSSIQSLNIFRICQEAITNATKHASAKQIHLNFIGEMNGDWKIMITDNGKGFSTGKLFENHFGIENMHQRAKEIKARFEIISTPGAGAMVVLSRN